MDGDIIAQFMKDNTLLTVYSGASIPTKGSSGEYSYYTITGERGSISYSLFSELYSGDDGLSVNNVYTEEGMWYFTEVYLDGELIDVDFADLDSTFETKSGGGSRRPGEKYGDCVRRVHADLKDAILDAHPVGCDLIQYCGTAAAIIAIIDCKDYGDTF